MTGTGLLLSVPSFVLLAVEIVALVLVIIGVRGRARILAAIGAALQVASFVASSFFTLMFNQVVHTFQLGSVEMQLLSAGVNLVTALVVGIGLVMIGLAIRPMRGRTRPAGPSTGVQA